jgi:hypothetical protein
MFPRTITACFALALSAFATTAAVAAPSPKEARVIRGMNVVVSAIEFAFDLKDPTLASFDSDFRKRTSGLTGPEKKFVYQTAQQIVAECEINRRDSRSGTISGEKCPVAVAREFNAELKDCYVGLEPNSMDGSVLHRICRDNIAHYDYKYSLRSEDLVSFTGWQTYTVDAKSTRDFTDDTKRDEGALSSTATLTLERGEQIVIETKLAWLDFGWGTSVKEVRFDNFKGPETKLSLDLAASGNRRERNVSARSKIDGANVPYEMYLKARNGIEPTYGSNYFSASRSN